MKYQDFFPETYRLDLKDEREFFFETYVGKLKRRRWRSTLFLSRYFR